MHASQPISRYGSVSAERQLQVTIMDSGGQEQELGRSARGFREERRAGETNKGREEKRARQGVED